VENRRLASIGLALVAALGLGVAGCSSTSTNGAGASPSATSEAPDPRVVLKQAAAELARTSFKLDMTAGPVTAHGVFDPSNKQGDMTMTVSAQGAKLDIGSRLIGGDMWLKIKGIPNMPDKWLHIDTAKLPADFSLGIKPGQADPVGADKLVNALSDVKAAGNDTYTGTLDLTKAAGSGVADENTLKVLGDKAKAVPFEAGVDGQGRLKAIKMDLGEIGGQRMLVNATYSDFGVTVSVTAPAAGEVMEAPDSVYQILNA
jgi:hypothetical protein